MVDIEYVDGSGVVVDAVDDSVGASSRAVAAGKGSKQGLVHVVGVDGECVFTEFEYGCGDGFGESV